MQTFKSNIEKAIFNIKNTNKDQKSVIEIRWEIFSNGGKIGYCETRDSAKKAAAQHESRTGVKHTVRKKVSMVVEIGLLEELY